MLAIISFASASPQFGGFGYPGGYGGNGGFGGGRGFGGGMLLNNNIFLCSRLNLVEQ